MTARPDDNPPRGRTAIDWEAAFAFYAALPAPRRSYAAVADEFGVSVRTVETHGRSGGWKTRLREIEATAARAADGELAQARSEELRKIGKLIEASFLEYANKLRRGEVRMTPADLERLHRLRQQLTDELTGVHAHTDPAPAPAARAPEHITAVIDALAEAGALEAFGLTRTPAADDDANPPTEEEHDD